MGSNCEEFWIEIGETYYLVKEVERAPAALIDFDQVLKSDHVDTSFIRVCL